MNTVLNLFVRCHHHHRRILGRIAPNWFAWQQLINVGIVMTTPQTHAHINIWQNHFEWTQVKFLVWRVRSDRKMNENFRSRNEHLLKTKRSSKSESRGKCEIDIKSRERLTVRIVHNMNTIHKWKGILLAHSTEAHWTKMLVK